MSVLIDTNILVYAWDSTEKKKQSQAIGVLSKYRKEAHLSVQNLSEFSAVMIRHGRDPGWVAFTDGDKQKTAGVRRFLGIAFVNTF